MLVIPRKAGQSIYVGSFTVTVTKIESDQITIDISHKGQKILKRGEKTWIDLGISLWPDRIRAQGDKVDICIDAPRSIIINRKEVFDKKPKPP